MANINKLTFTFVDGQTTIKQNHLNSIVNTINQLIDVVGGDTPTPSTVAKPQISISGSTATITCSTSSATIRYAINGTPTESSGTIIANGGTINLSSYAQSTVIRAIAYKSGMTTSQVAETTYTPSISPEAQAALAKFSNLSSAQQTKVKNFVDTLVSSGIYSKLHYLSFPTMAANVSEALQNIVSSEAPPTAENFSIAGGGLKATAKGPVELTSLLSGTVDYDDVALAFSIENDTTASVGTSRAVALGPSSNSTCMRVWATSSSVLYKGFAAQKTITVDANNIAIGIVSHNKSAQIEKYCYDGTGEITSEADSQTPSNVGLYISSNTEQASTSYNTWFSGVYRFIMMSQSLTDAQITALNTAIRTFLA